MAPNGRRATGRALRTTARLAAARGMAASVPDHGLTRCQACMHACQPGPTVTPAPPLYVVAHVVGDDGAVREWKVSKPGGGGRLHAARSVRRCRAACGHGPLLRAGRFG